MKSTAQGMDLLRTRATVTVREAFENTGIPIRSLRALVASGRIEATRYHGERLLLFAASVLKHLESNRLPCRPEARVTGAKGDAS